jgi:SAM-dependent methyltransferase
MYPERLSSHNWLIHRIGNAMVRRRLPSFSGRVLDVGCGERPFEADVLCHASSYVGMDWSNSLHGLKADVIADANRSLPFRDGAFDHVLAFEVLEHLAEPEAMLKEAHRVLRRGGELTLSMPFQWWVHEAPWDYQRFTSYGLDYRLQKAGFKDISIEPRTGFWSMWILKFNYQTTRLLRGPKPMRWLTRALLVPFWWINQSIAPWLDRIWPDDRETAGYFVTAKKP